MGHALLFNHPGGEHVPSPGETEYAWNRAPHRRKFLVADAYVANQRGERDFRRSAEPMQVGFWGEWEPPSQCGLFPPSDDDSMLPLAWHRPLLGSSPPEDAQNTDPWVFGETMRYSNCRQKRYERLRNLSGGDVLFFGSVKKRDEVGNKTDAWRFYLDTAFVVDAGHQYRFDGSVPSLPAQAPVDDVFRSHVLAPLGRQEPNQEFRLYGARMLASSSAGAFSYVPCKLVEKEPATARFARPRIDDLFMSSYPHPIAGVVPLACGADEAWQRVTQRCLQRGVELAVRIAV